MYLPLWLVAALVQAVLNTLVFALLYVWISARAETFTAWQWLVMAAGQLLCVLLGARMLRYVMGWRRRRSYRLHPLVRQERQRIAQDLHDGVGAHLFHALTLLKTQPANCTQVLTCIEHAMWSLRVEMQALDDVDANLLDLLASARWRLQPLLDLRGIEMDWQINIHDEALSPSGGRAKEISLLAQEAISNVLQHAECRILRVHLHQLSGGVWQLDVIDDGKGFEMPHQRTKEERRNAKSGKGLGNMQQRAQRAKAQLQIQSQPGQGCHVCVQWLPGHP